MLVKRGGGSSFSQLAHILAENSKEIMLSLTHDDCESVSLSEWLTGIATVAPAAFARNRSEQTELFHKYNVNDDGILTDSELAQLLLCETSNKLLCVTMMRLARTAVQAS